MLNRIEARAVVSAPRAILSVVRHPAAELRQAGRSLRRTPWYSLTVVTVIALGMGLAATVFAVVDGVLFRALPFPKAHELYALSGVFHDEPAPPRRVVRLLSPREQAAWRDAVDVPVTSLAHSSMQFPDGQFARTARVDRYFFDVFGVRPLIGGFHDEHYARGRPVPAVLLSYRVWQSRFGGDPGVVGQIIRPITRERSSSAGGLLGDPGFEIAGVLAPDAFIPPLPNEDRAAARRENRIDALMASPLPTEGGERWLTAFARVPADRLDRSTAWLSHAATDLRRATPPRPDIPARQRVAFAPYDDVALVPIARLLSGRERPVLGLVFATAMSLVALVLLNVGALTAARVQQRVRDLAVRRALGARTRDLLRHALAEQALLVGAGTAAGLVLAPMLLALVLQRLPPGLTLIKDPQLDWRVLAFAALLSSAATLLVALLGLRVGASQAHFAPAMAAAHGDTPRRAKTGRVLLAGQVALAFTLILGGVFFSASLARVWQEDAGIRTRDGAMIGVFFGDRVPRATAVGLAAGLRAVPGVTGAGVFDAPILENIGHESRFQPPDGAPRGGPAPASILVSAGFFDAAGLRLLAGRFPTGAELDAGAPVVVVSDTVARTYWPGAEAVGQTLRTGRTTCTVVGIVGDARLFALDSAPEGAIYGSLALQSFEVFGVSVFLAFESGRNEVLAAVLAHIARTDPAVQVTNVRRIEDAVADSIRPRRLSAFAASVFAGCALVVMAVGLLGLVAMTSSRRTREVGIRMALGATPARVVRLLVGEQLVTVCAGLGAGALIGFWAVRWIEAHLYEVTAYDPSIWITSVAIVVLTATLGALVPALRAGRIDPVQALRRE